MNRKSIEWEIDDCKRYLEEIRTMAESGKISPEKYETEKKKIFRDLEYYENERAIKLQDKE